MPNYIPQEILDKIIGYASDEPNVGRKFSNCASFVSHNFHQIILPYKFRSLTFQLHNGDTSNRYFRLQDIPKFLKAINAGDAHALSLAPLVQELSIVGNRLIPEAPGKDPLKIIMNSFQNLTYLKMERCIASESATMEQLGKLVQLQSLHTLFCGDWQHEIFHDHHYADKASYALSNLQSLHTLECEGDWKNFRRHLACIPMKNLRILKSSDSEVIKALLTSDPPVQLKELSLHYDDYSLVWNYLARVTSLTRLCLPDLKLSDEPPSLIFSFQELQYLHIHVAFAPRFANQPLKKMKIDSELGKLMVEVRQHWQGIVFPYVERLEADRLYDELDEIPFEFWREFLPNVNEVTVVST